MLLLCGFKIMSLSIRHVSLHFAGLSDREGGGALYVEMRFYGDISWEPRCNIEINVRAHFCKILLVFEVP